MNIDGSFSPILNKKLVSIEISADSDNTVHSKITCGENKGFKDVSRGIELIIKELQNQLDNSNKCPFYKK